MAFFCGQASSSYDATACRPAAATSGASATTCCDDHEAAAGAASKAADGCAEGEGQGSPVAASKWRVAAFAQAHAARRLCSKERLVQEMEPSSTSWHLLGVVLHRSWPASSMIMQSLATSRS